MNLVNLIVLLISIILVMANPLTIDESINRTAQQPPRRPSIRICTSTLYIDLREANPVAWIQ